MELQGAKITLVDYNLFSFRVKYSELAAKWEELRRKLEALPYPQDGIVIKLADSAYSASLGNTAHHPRGEIAFKFTNIRRETRLIGVEWSFGKNCLTPVGGAGTGRNLRHHHPPRHVAQHPEHSRTGRADRRYRDR